MFSEQFSAAPHLGEDKPCSCFLLGGLYPLRWGAELPFFQRRFYFELHFLLATAKHNRTPSATLFHCKSLATAGRVTRKGAPFLLRREGGSADLEAACRCAHRAVMAAAWVPFWGLGFHTLFKGIWVHMLSGKLCILYPLYGFLSHILEALTTFFATKEHPVGLDTHSPRGPPASFQPAWGGGGGSAPPLSCARSSVVLALMHSQPLRVLKGLLTSFESAYTPVFADFHVCFHDAPSSLILYWICDHSHWLYKRPFPAWIRTW